MGPMILCCDSQVTITYMKEPMYHSMTMVDDPFTNAISADLYEKQVKGQDLRRI